MVSIIFVVFFIVFALGEIGGGMSFLNVSAIGWTGRGSWGVRIEEMRIDTASSGKLRSQKRGEHVFHCRYHDDDDVQARARACRVSAKPEPEARPG